MEKKQMSTLLVSSRNTTWKEAFDRLERDWAKEYDCKVSLKMKAEGPTVKE